MPKVATTEAEKDLLETLFNAMMQACESRGVWDSQALSYYADGLRLLEEYGKLEITDEYGRRVIAKVPEAE